MFKEKLLGRWLNGGCGGPFFYRWAGPDKTLFPCVPIAVSLAMSKLDLWPDGLEDPNASIAIIWSTTMLLDTKDDFAESRLVGVVYLVGVDTFLYGTFVDASRTGKELVKFKACGVFDGNQETLRPRHNSRLPNNPISPQ